VPEPAAPDEAAQLLELPYVRLLHRRNVAGPPAGAAGQAAGHSQQQQQQQQQQAAAAVTEVALEVVIPRPCWGTLRLSGVDLVSWEVIPGQHTDAAAFVAKQHRSSGSALMQPTDGRGSQGWGAAHVRALIIKFSSEQWQGPLRWRLVVRFDAGAAAQQPRDEQQLAAELHVGHVDSTPQLAAMAARMPAWATITYHATILVSRWSF
jgi:hypothetical protein